MMCNADYATRSQRASRMCYQGALLWRRISIYLARHNAALKILFFEILRDLGLLEEVPPWYSPVEPKPTHESRDAQAFWDIPVYAVQTEVRANIFSKLFKIFPTYLHKACCRICMSGYFTIPYRTISQKILKEYSNELCE